MPYRLPINLSPKSPIFSQEQSTCSPLLKKMYDCFNIALRWLYLFIELYDKGMLVLQVLMYKEAIQEGKVFIEDLEDGFKRKL